MLTTSRLRLIPATPSLIDAELAGHKRLEEMLAVALPLDWPPEHHDADTLKFWRGKLSEPDAAGWWLYYVVLARSPHPALVGNVSYKGPPNEGAVEIGYSVVPSWQRQGLATEACRALIDSAWDRGASVTVAHTFDALEPSIRVLRKLGFEPTVPSEPSEPGLLAFTLRRHRR